jgi:hypothetical protein
MVDIESTEDDRHLATRESTQQEAAPRGRRRREE